MTFGFSKAGSMNKKFVQKFQNLTKYFYLKSSLMSKQNSTSSKQGKNRKSLPGSNCSHASWLISSIRLRTILKIRVRSTGAIYTNIPRSRNMWAPMWLRHNRHNCDSGGGSDRFGSELREKGLTVGLGKSRDHLHQLWGACKSVFSTCGGFDRV